MDEITYCVYRFLSSDNDVYIGITKNFEVRMHQHFYKSCNSGLRKLIDDQKVQLTTEILFKGLTREEASLLEKKLIKKYRNDSEYTLLNIQSGGMRGNRKLPQTKKVICQENIKHLSNDMVLKIRQKYYQMRYYAEPKFKVECIQYNLSHNYFKKILRGMARRNVGGPILGKDYKW